MVPNFTGGIPPGIPPSAPGGGPADCCESERLKKFITYGYLLAFFAFVAGIFNPLTNPNADPVAVLIGILVLIVGLVGGIQLYQAVTIEENRIIRLIAGFGLISGSLWGIFWVVNPN